MRHALLLALVVGCGPKFVELDTARVRKIDVGVVDASTAFCPQAGPPELRARVTYRDNNFVQTRSRIDPRGTLRPSELRWTSDVGTIDDSARMQLPPLLTWHDRPLSITVSVPGRPEVADRIVLTPTYDCDGRSRHDGPAGWAGGDGTHAGYAEVSLAYVDTQLNGRLVLVRVVGEGSAPEYYLLDRRGPSAARFVVSARGGDGGGGVDGSDGSRGFDGLAGSDGSAGGTCEDGGDGGDAGDGGDGGDGGDAGDGGNGADGGTVVITYPAEFPELADVVEVDVRGGYAGAGGRGGSGGSGGSGGRAGSGGSAGSTIDVDGKHCSTSSGDAGRAGRDGRSGSSGSDGSDGRAGSSGTIVRRASTIEALFGGEAADGWAIASAR
ncbi:MAG TPA: hypothetical protein VIV11_14135 [Kofleriaceae bacterium]